ncbi:MAG: fibronectin type III domain-containing protein, partial [Treponema sp.]|nr:fibronectin type III domain-containing protein [Treponema sp.]
AVSATTKIEPPTEVSAAAADSSSITVSWKEVSGASGYRVYRSAEHYGSYDPVGEDLPSTTTSWTDTGLEPNTAYYYYVSAYNANGEGAGASVVSATTKIGTPSGVSAAAADSSNIKVSWNQVSGASYYKVYRSASSDGVYSSTGTHITSTTWIDTGLQPNTTYYYKVSASPSYYGEDGAQSPAVSATTHANGN